MTEKQRQRTEAMRRYLKKHPEKLLEYFDKLADIVEQMRTEYLNYLGDEADEVARHYYKKYGGGQDE